MGNLSYGMSPSSWFDRAQQGQVFSAFANVTSLGAYTSGTAIGGPLLWNGTGAAIGTRNQVKAVLLGIGVGITTASAAGASVGVAGGIGQTAAPTSTTAIDAVGNVMLGGPAPQCSVYRLGTTTNAGSVFIPTHSLGTGALTVDNIDVSWTDLSGLMVVQPGNWMAVAANTVATTGVLQIGLVWAEIPY